jgi:hypothetical protein
MKLVHLTAIIPAAALALSACASDGYYEGRGGVGVGYGYGHRYAGTWYDPWYDSYYGPIYGGYWGPSDVFYYQLGPGGRYFADSGRHFRRDRFDGGVNIHVRDWRNDGHRGRGR